MTLPFAPWVTDVRTGVPSKLSALAPLVPVSTLAVMAVSSFVVRLSSTMSATAVTPMLISCVAVWPSSSVIVTVKVSLPLKSAFGV